MNERKGISKRTRFEVFKRDSFKCQYCGKSAPDVILHIDHIIPVSKGGDNKLFNLITSCEDCNSGKSNVTLEAKEQIKKQKSELDKLQEHRSQIEMMAEWRKGLVEAKTLEVETLAQAWAQLTNGRETLNSNGHQLLRKLLKNFTFKEVLDAMHESFGAYCGGELTHEKACLAVNKIGGCARMAQIAKDSPETVEFYKIRAILRNKGGHIPWHAIKTIRQYFESGMEIQQLKEIAIDARNWGSFEFKLSKFLAP